MQGSCYPAYIYIIIYVMYTCTKTKSEIISVLNRLLVFIHSHIKIHQKVDYFLLLLCSFPPPDLLPPPPRFFESANLERISLDARTISSNDGLESGSVDNI